MSDKLIAVIDDDEAVRLSTCELLERTGFEVETYESGDLFIGTPNPDRFCCILLDMQMPGSDGLAVLESLRGKASVAPVLVITGHGDIALAVSAMKLGAHDFMEKPYKPTDLLDAIEAMRARRTKLRDAAFEGAEAKALVARLSQRQHAVLLGIIDGQPNKIIAWNLGLSIRTVEAYRSQMLAKLGVKGTAEAVRLAIAAGLGDTPGASK